MAQTQNQVWEMNCNFKYKTKVAVEEIFNVKKNE